LGPAAAIVIGLSASAVSYFATFVFTAVMTFIIPKPVDAMIGLRITSHEEDQGLDLMLHDERGYDL
jgi:Amt family ammonium transporter